MIQRYDITAFLNEEERIGMSTYTSRNGAWCKWEDVERLSEGQVPQSLLDALIRENKLLISALAAKYEDECDYS